MNGLSWLLYAADVANSADSVCDFVLVGGAIAAVSTAGVSGVIRHLEEDLVAFSAAAWRWAVRFGSAALIAAVIGTAIPSKETVYAIAASEMGERALKTPTGSKAIQALDAWLDRQIAGASDGALGRQGGQLRDTNNSTPIRLEKP